MSDADAISKGSLLKHIFSEKQLLPRDKAFHFDGAIVGFADDDVVIDGDAHQEPHSHTGNHQTPLFLH